MGLLERAIRLKNDLTHRGDNKPTNESVLPEVNGEEEIDDTEIIILEASDLMPVDDSSELNDVIEEAPPKEEDTSEENPLPDELKDAIPESLDRGIQKEPEIGPTTTIPAPVEEEMTELSQDLAVINEISQQILWSETREALFDTLLFSIMGQIGVSSSTVLLPSKDNVDIWEIETSRGVEIADKQFRCDANNAIMRKMFERKDIIDIDEFRDNPEFSKDYFRFISMDTRLLIPLVMDGAIVCLMILGDKLSGMDYSAEDKNFLRAVVDYSAIALRKMTPRIAAGDDQDLDRDLMEVFKEVDRIQELILSDANLDRVELIIQKEFKAMGVESFALFAANNSKDSFFPIITEREDFIQLKEKKCDIRIASNFVHFINSKENIIDVKDFFSSKVVAEVFSESMIKKMSMLRMYPFKIGGITLGFIILFRVSHAAKLSEVDAKMKRLSAMVFEYIESIIDLDHNKNKYTDTIEHVYSRIEKEIMHAKSKNVPVSLTLFSIKNYKRYYHLYGYDDVKLLLESFERIIRNRLSDGDFSIRYDKNKIIMVLPGKDKKYAVPLANSIRNEVLKNFQKKDIQLLITFIIAEFPGDGNNIYSLLDTIE